jgi:hypothetical protein
MRVLLIHPEDSPRRGPWSRQRWDLIVDLGKSSQYSEAAWAEQYACPVLRSESFRQGVADTKLVREMFSAGRGQLLDEEGIDWWDLTSLLIVPDALTALALRRVAGEISPLAELWTTRQGSSVSALTVLLGRSVRTFVAGGFARSTARTMHYAGLIGRFSPAQIKEIFLDKYDSSYRWRSRFATRPRRCTSPVILVPSAYGNVSRMGGAYASLLPQQSFLMIATRQSARQFEPPSNVQVRDLAAYANSEFPRSEVESLVQRWMSLRVSMSSPEMNVLTQAGVLDPFPGWLRDGLSARNAWRAIMEQEPVCGVLCGDDSNLFTRLPVLLAARRKIPTVDFHHGAFDGRYLLKDLPCDVYLAKNEMERDYLVRVCGIRAERIVIGAPASVHAGPATEQAQVKKTSIVFFSEPYEVASLRAEEVYRELLPALCRVARQNGRNLVIKLHPFESRAERGRLVQEILSSEERNLVKLQDGPLTSELLAQAWFGITVESTTVIDCLQNGVCCFLCGWLTLSPYEYQQQYARFGVGQILGNLEQVSEIPSRLGNLQNQPVPSGVLSKAANPAMLRRWLTAGSFESSGARSAP